MSETHNADNVCPIIEEHKRRNTAKVWFSSAVAKTFKTYDERASLVAALGDEINQIPSDYISYILLNFKQMTFVCSTLWVKKKEFISWKLIWLLKPFKLATSSFMKTRPMNSMKNN